MERDITTLADAPIGVPLYVVRISCGRQAQLRLSDMGIVPGAQLVLLNKMGGGGPFKVEVGADRFAIGAGLSRHVIVRPLSKDNSVRLGLFTVGRVDVDNFDSLLGNGIGSSCLRTNNNMLSCEFLGRASFSGKASLSGRLQNFFDGRFEGFVLYFDYKDMFAGITTAAVFLQARVRFFIVISGLIEECKEIDIDALSRLLRVKVFDANRITDNCVFWDIALQAIVSCDVDNYPLFPLSDEFVKLLSPMLLAVSESVGKMAYPFVLFCLEDKENCPIVFSNVKDTLLPKLLMEREKVINGVEAKFGKEARRIIEEARFGFVNGLLREVERSSMCRRISVSRMLDTLFLNPVLGLPMAFVLLFASVFALLEAGVFLFAGFSNLCQWLSSTGFVVLSALVYAGGGVFLVSAFLLFSFVLFEGFKQSNYIKRIGFLLDSALHRIGFHGVVFQELLKSAVCPLACPTSIAPQFICIGKVLVLSCIFYIAGVPMPERILLLLAFILLSILSSLLLYKRIDNVSAEGRPLVMDLPPYALPKPGFVFGQAFIYVSAFLRKAGLWLFFVLTFVAGIISYLMKIRPMGVDFLQHSFAVKSIFTLALIISKAVFLLLAALLYSGKIRLSFDLVVLWSVLLAFLPNCPIAVRSRRAVVFGVVSLLVAMGWIYLTSR